MMWGRILEDPRSILKSTYAQQTTLSLSLQILESHGRCVFCEKFSLKKWASRDYMSVVFGGVVKFVNFNIRNYDEV